MARCDAVTALHVFDMDGTLLPATTASIELAKVTGHTRGTARAGVQVRRRRARHARFARAIYELWADLTPDDVVAAFAGARRLGRIADVLTDVRDRREHSLVITMSPDFFAKELVTLGADAVVASTFPPPPFAGAPLDPTGILTPADKPRIVTEQLRSLDLRIERCVAFGDSMSDAPLFRVLRHTVAVNADDHLLDLAAARYDGDDLWEAYQLGRALLGGSRHRSRGPRKR